MPQQKTSSEDLDKPTFLRCFKKEQMAKDVLIGQFKMGFTQWG